MEGGINEKGEANVRIELASIDTSNDLRNVRMRFLLFETFKFPHAEISAKLNKAKLRTLSTNTRIAYLLDFKISMHGFEKEFQAPVWITQINEATVSVATIKPIIVSTDSFGLTDNVGKLVELIGGKLIAPAASITFDLVFGTGTQKSELQLARAAREKRRAEEARDTITAEACQTRFRVISRTGAIYFRSGSDDLDQKSTPLLDSLVDIANRCPSVKIKVEGHTDTVGTAKSNQLLSELRAKSVVDFLTKEGVSASRIQSTGYGDTRPVAPNNSKSNRAMNRRIEFKVR